MENEELKMDELLRVTWDQPFPDNSTFHIPHYWV
jgi:hypothetical protein